MADFQIDKAFIKQYEAEVHAAYQQQGSRLRGTVRTKNGVVGLSTTFQKVGKGQAGSKTRHGKVPVMGVEHSAVECFVEDYYAGDWVDTLDEYKTNIDERRVITNAGAWALGRKSDNLIITAAATTTTATSVDASSGMTLNKAMQIIELLNAADVPDDGNRYVWVAPQQWTQLLVIKEFASADWIGSSVPMPDGGKGGMGGRMWLGAKWGHHTGLPKAGNDRTCIAYHMTALGHAVGADVRADITWHGDRASHFVNNMMSQGACLIDATGVVKSVCVET